MKLRVDVATLILMPSCAAFTSMPAVQLNRFGAASSHSKDGNPEARYQVRTRVNVNMKAEEGASGVGSLKNWDPSAMQQAFVKPALHNKNSVRTVAIVTTTALAARGSLLAPGNIAKFVHLISFAAWMGSTLWVTFVAGITMFRNLPRQTFGKIQAKLFPKYFLLNFCAIFAICTVRNCSVRSPGCVAVVVALFSNLLNLVLLEPRSTNIMMKRYKLEDEDKRNSTEYKELGQQFGKYHGASSLVNLMALIGAFVYAWDLASKLPV